MELSDEWKGFETAIGMRVKVKGDTIEDIRAGYAKDRASRSPLAASESLIISDVHEADFRLRTYVPKTLSDGLPLQIYIHGGGFCLGDLDSEELTARFLAETGPAIVVSIEYRLAPEYPWPTSLNDCVAGTKWALSHFSEAKYADTTSLFVSGGSAGGQLALALTVKLIEQGTEVSGVLAICPIAIGESAVPANMKHKYLAIEQNSDAPLVDAALYRKFMKLNGHDDKDPYFSTLLSPTLRKFPTTYIATCGADVLRDDGFLLAETLRSYGVQVKHDNYPGYPHYFWSVPGIAESVNFYNKLGEGVKFLFLGGKTL